MLIFLDHAIQGAIFDMDGTMFDTERLRFQTLKHASKEILEEEFSDEYLTQCLGLTMQASEQLAQKMYGDDIPYQEIRKRAEQLEFEFVRQHGVPIKNGLIEVLERLRKSGLRMAVATSTRRAVTEEYLINANIYKFFDVVICGDEISFSKPHPEIFLTAARKLNLLPEQCLMFEDSEHGICAACDAGGVTILFKDIKEPNDYMLSKANYYYQDMDEYLNILDQYMPQLEMPHLQESFPQSLNQLTVGIHGFGAMGGGYIAQILSHWDGYTRPKQILASSRNPLLIEAVNSFASYSIRYSQCCYDERIENLKVINANNEQDMLELYTQSSLIALCLPEYAIESETKIMAKGLLTRFNAQDLQRNEPITFLIISEQGNTKYKVLKCVRDALLEISDEDITDHILAEHYMCDTVINRKVTKLSDQELFRQIKIKHGLFKQFQTDLNEETIDLLESTTLTTKQEQKAVSCLEDIRGQYQAGQFLQNMDLILFHSEVDMPMYVENRSPLLNKMRQIIVIDHISDIQLIRNRLWEAAYTMLAWYGDQLGYETIGIAMDHPEISEFVEAVVAEIKLGLINQLPQHLKELDRMEESFLNACRVAYKIPCEQVIKNSMQKPAFNEQVLASIENNIQQQLPYTSLLKGIVSGYLYALRKSLLNKIGVFEHIQVHIEKMNISEQQKQTVFNLVCTKIQQQIMQDDIAELNLQHSMPSQAEYI